MNNKIAMKRRTQNCKSNCLLRKRVIGLLRGLKRVGSNVPKKIDEPTSALKAIMETLWKQLRQSIKKKGNLQYITTLAGFFLSKLVEFCLLIYVVIGAVALCSGICVTLHNIYTYLYVYIKVYVKKVMNSPLSLLIQNHYIINSLPHQYHIICVHVHVL